MKPEKERALRKLAEKEAPNHQNFLVIVELFGVIDRLRKELQEERKRPRNGVRTKDYRYFTKLPGGF